MYRLVLVAIVFSTNTAAYGQLAKKPQTPTPAPLIREAFMPKGDDVLISYPMDAKLDGKPIWLWKYHKRKLADLSITNALGQELKTEEIRKTLQKPSVILLSTDGKPIHPYYLKVIKPDTLVIIDRTQQPKPIKKPKQPG